MATQIHFILDRSGSMHDCLDDTIGGFNAFLATQQNEKADKATFSLYLFDHEYEIVYENKAIEEVENLNRDTFIPRGRTALLDAIGKTIKNVKETDNSSTVIVILTDGLENNSNEYTKSHINDLISSKKEKGWQFVYLGANQDAIQEGSSLGIGKQQAYTFSQDKDGLEVCFSNLGSAMSNFRQTPMKQRTASSINISQ